MLRYLLKSAKVQYVILGPAGFASETFRVFIDLFAFLRSIRGSSDARKGENEVNANVGEFSVIFVFFMAP